MKEISRRDFIKSSIGGALAASSLGCRLKKAHKQPLNLVYIMTDQQPVSTLGCYGNPLNPTPNLDRLAASGERFNNFYISAFPCSPSRSCMLTGLYPQQHGVITNNVLLSDELPSMGYILGDSGRDTGFFGKSHLKGHMYRNVPWREPFNGAWYLQRIPDDKEYRFEKVKGGYGEDKPQLGFDTWAGGWKDYHTYLKDVGLGKFLEERAKPGNHNDLPNVGEGEHRFSRLPEEHHMAAFFSGKAVDFIKSLRGKEQPFGMVLSFYGPHLPVAPPRPWDEKYSLDQCPLPPNHFDTLAGKPLAQKNNKVCYKLPVWQDEQFKDYIRRYYGYSAYIDAQIGRVLNALTECGFDDNTVVIFTSDHGDMLAAHGFVYKMGNCGYQELAHVPFIIRAPGVTQPGSVAHAFAGNVDIMPTLIDLLGLPGQNGMQGKSFYNVLSGKKDLHRDRIYTLWSGGGYSYVTFNGEWKYALHVNAETDEMYNLIDDPGEMKNLAGKAKYAVIEKQRRREIIDWLHETGHPYADVVRSLRQATAP